MERTRESSRAGQYQAYLVRLWRDSPQEPWRASIKQVPTSAERYFASPEKLILFLYEQMVVGVDPDIVPESGE